MINTLEELKLALSDKNEFERLVTNFADLEDAFKKYPDHKTILLEKVISDPIQFKRLIEFHYELIELVDRFPNHVKKILQPVLSDPNEFKRVFKSAYELAQVAAVCPEKHAEALLHPILSNPVEFKIWVKKPAALKFLKTKFPQYDIFQSNNLEGAERLLKMRTPQALAYTQGATIGAFQFFPSDITNHISTFLNRKDGGRLSGVKTTAYTTAKEKEKEVEETMKLKKY